MMIDQLLEIWNKLDEPARRDVICAARGALARQQALASAEPKVQSPQRSSLRLVIDNTH
jgi:hypothetical protein